MSYMGKTVDMYGNELSRPPCSFIRLLMTLTDAMSSAGWTALFLRRHLSSQSVQNAGHEALPSPKWR